MLRYFVPKGCRWHLCLLPMVSSYIQCRNAQHEKGQARAPGIPSLINVTPPTLLKGGIICRRIYYDHSQEGFRLSCPHPLGLAGRHTGPRSPTGLPAVMTIRVRTLVSTCPR